MEINDQWLVAEKSEQCLNAKVFLTTKLDHVTYS